MDSSTPTDSSPTDSYGFPDPLLVAPDTFLVRHLRRRPGEELATHVNSVVVLGAQPVLVDTGAARAREAWAEQTFGLVDPDDVRWIVVTHHGPDHVGNLALAVEACSQATVALAASTREHLHGRGIELADGRVRILADGDTLHLPDRDLLVVRPPVFDSPGSLGVFDTSTRWYWACDAFSAPVPGPVDDVATMPDGTWQVALEDGCRELAPWSKIVDPVRFDEWVERIARLEPTVLTSARGPVVRGDSIRRALECLRHA